MSEQLPARKVFQGKNKSAVFCGHLFRVTKWGGSWDVCGGGGDVKKGVMELKMGLVWAMVVNILSWTFMIGSAAARQDQTPSYEELGEMKKILHFS